MEEGSSYIICDNDEHSEKTPFSIEVIWDGIFISVNDEQYLNANLFINVTELGIDNFFNDLQSKNADFLIEFRLEWFIFILVNDMHLQNVNLLIDDIKCGISIRINDLHDAKALLPMNDKFEYSFISFNETHSSKALSLIISIDEGIIIFTKEW